MKLFTTAVKETIRKGHVSMIGAVDEDNDTTSVNLEDVIDQQMKQETGSVKVVDSGVIQGILTILCKPYAGFLDVEGWLLDEKVSPLIDIVNTFIAEYKLVQATKGLSWFALKLDQWFRDNTRDSNTELYKTIHENIYNLVEKQGLVDKAPWVTDMDQFIDVATGHLVGLVEVCKNKGKYFPKK